MTELPDKPKRVSLSELLTQKHEETMAFASRPPRDHDTLTLKTNAKGDTQIELSCRRLDEETFEQWESRVAASYDRLRARYPMSNGDSVEEALKRSLKQVGK